MFRSTLTTLVTMLWLVVLMGASDCGTEPRSSCGDHEDCPGSYCASDGYCSVG
jgi:hypothetical protein